MRNVNSHRRHLPSAICHLLLFAFCIFNFSLPAAETEPPFERGLVLIRNELLAARTGWRALAVAVRPGEEDAESLAYLRNTPGAETHVCFLTRGDLFQPWTAGMRVFDRLLLDADPALNAGKKIT